MVTFAKISPNMVNTRDIAGNAEKEEEEWFISKQSVARCCCYLLKFM